MYKRGVLSIVLSLSMICALPVQAGGVQEEVEFTELPAAAAADETLPARSAVLMDQENGRVLFEKDADIQMPPASITKVMVLLLAMEAMAQNRMTLEDDVVCSAYAASMGGSQIWLEPGEIMKMDDILKAVTISSANDAAVALAEHLAGSEEAFVEMMNNRAAELSMRGTHFVNVTGLDADGHLSTARDIAVMSRELLRYPEITEYSKVWMSALRDGKTQLVNTNKLVRFYNGCTGLKTGTTNGAGSCLSASATRKGMSLIAVTMGSATSAQRFSAARGLLDYGFSNFLRLPTPVPEKLLPIKVQNGVERLIEPLPIPPESIVVTSGEKAKLEQQVQMEESLKAPVLAGQTVGEVTILADGKPLLSYPLAAPRDVPEMTFGTSFSLLLSEMLRL